MKNTLIKNTLILVVCSLIVKALGLINRVVLTQLLGLEGIGLYIISIPSVMLFMSIGGLSLNIAISKIVSENIVTNKYSNKSILKKALLIGLISSILTSIILIIILKPLSYNWLKQPDSYYPILVTIVIIPLVAGNNILRGYYNGINKINIGAYASIIEQISRIIISIIFLYIFAPFGIIVTVTMTIAAMGIGEIVSLFYSIILLKKYRTTSTSLNQNPTKDILNCAIPTTASRLTGNFAYFLEPIIYTAALTLTNFTPDEIITKYSIITAYAIPLITLFSFISTSIATAIIPNISKTYATKDTIRTCFYAKKAILLSFLPGILITILLTIYGDEYMKLLFGTHLGSDYVMHLSFFFILFYIQSPLIAIMQAIGKAKAHFFISLISNVLKLIVIFSFVFIPKIGFNSLIISFIINVNISTLVYYFYLKNNLKFAFTKGEILNTIILSIFTVLLAYLIKIGLNINYIIATLIITITFFSASIILKLTSFRNK